MEDWYKLKIEEPIRNLVKLLRDNGFNTTCSCGHYPKPYVQMESHSSHEVDRLYDLLIENGYKNFCILLTWNCYDDLNDYKKNLEITFFVRNKLIKESDIRDEKK